MSSVRREEAPPLRIEDRKDLLLLILAARGESEDAEPIIGVTRLQKYMFLLQQEYRWHERFGISDPYRFEAYDYGPFDSQLYDDLQFLENAHLIRREPAGTESPVEDQESRQLAYESGTVGPELAPWEDEDTIYRYSLDVRGREFARRYALDESDRETLVELKRRWNKRSLQDLLSWLYDKYPSFAENTKLKWLTRGQ